MDAEKLFDRFIASARNTCLEIEQFHVGRTDEMLAVLIELLQCAHALTTQPAEVNDEYFFFPTAVTDHLNNIPDDICFYEVFDPSDQRSLCATSLRDSLGDIYSSLKGGLSVLDANPEKAADVRWEWRDDFANHWGRHLVDVIRFLVLTHRQVAP